MKIVQRLFYVYNTLKGSAVQRHVRIDMPSNVLHHVCVL